MNIFLAGIIQGSIVEEAIHAQDWREPITELINKYIPDAKIYCHYTQHPNSITYTGGKIRDTFEDGVQRCRDADLIIAYLPSASMGTSIEIYEAYNTGTKVLTITKMTANWVVKLYSHEIFLNLSELESFLQAGKLEDLMRN